MASSVYPATGVEGSQCGILIDLTWLQHSAGHRNKFNFVSIFSTTKSEVRPHLY